MYLSILSLEITQTDKTSALVEAMGWKRKWRLAGAKPWASRAVCHPPEQNTASPIVHWAQNVGPCCGGLSWMPGLWLLPRVSSCESHRERSPIPGALALPVPGTPTTLATLLRCQCGSPLPSSLTFSCCCSLLIHALWAHNCGPPHWTVTCLLSGLALP